MLRARRSRQPADEAGGRGLAPQIAERNPAIQQFAGRHPEEGRCLAGPEPQAGETLTRTGQHGDRAGVGPGDEDRRTVPDDVDARVGQHDACHGLARPRCPQARHAAARAASGRPLGITLLRCHVPILPPHSDSPVRNPYSASGGDSDPEVGRGRSPPRLEPKNCIAPSTAMTRRESPRAANACCGRYGAPRHSASGLEGS